MKTPPIALWLWYRGDTVRGYQRQLKGPPVQSALEEALRAAGIQGSPRPAGRTDLGVHARMQVVSFRPKGGGEPEEIARAISPHLPRLMGICAAARGAPEFHAQWSASGKQYRYRISLGPFAPPGWEHCAWRPAEQPRLHARGVAPERLDALLRRAEGTRDFIAFHEKSSVQKPRALWGCALEELGGGLFEARLRGEGFARYQVRYLVGTAVAVAAGKLPEEDWAAALETGKELAGFKAPAEALVLWEVEYPKEVDPFPPELRQRAPGLPEEPPFAARA